MCELEKMYTHGYYNNLSNNNIHCAKLVQHWNANTLQFRPQKTNDHTHKSTTQHAYFTVWYCAAGPFLTRVPSVSTTTPLPRPAGFDLAGQLKVRIGEL